MLGFGCIVFLSDFLYVYRILCTILEKGVRGRGRGLSLGGGATGRRRVSTEPKNFCGEAADHGGIHAEADGERRRRRCGEAAEREREDDGGKGDAFSLTGTSPNGEPAESRPPRRSSRELGAAAVANWERSRHRHFP